MYKKIIVVAFVILTVFGISGCKKEEKIMTDALKFKEEYEKLNNTQNSSGKTYRSVTISEDNPMVYATAGDIVNMINNKETFAVYFGFSSCPWCRSMLTPLMKAAKDLNIQKIYYVDVKDIRDVRKVNKKNKVEITKEGTEDYYKLLSLLDNVLSEYTLTGSNNKTIKTGVKRIYAPNVISVINGEAEKLEEGISSKQTDSYMELTEEMLDESYNKVKCVLECVKAKDSCEVNTVC